MAAVYWYKGSIALTNPFINNLLTNALFHFNEMRLSHSTLMNSFNRILWAYSQGNDLSIDSQNPFRQLPRIPLPSIQHQPLLLHAHCCTLPFHCVLHVRSHYFKNKKLRSSSDVKLITNSLSACLAQVAQYDSWGRIQFLMWAWIWTWRAWMPKLWRCGVLS